MKKPGTKNLGASVRQRLLNKARLRRIAFIPAAHKIDFHEYDVPAPPAGGVVAQVTQTNVCASEVHIWRGEFGGRNGMMPGHEMSGRVMVLGDGAGNPAT